MADNIKVLGSVDVSAVNVATNEIGGVHYPVYKISYGIDGVQVPVSDTNKLPVIGPLTDTELRASAIPVTGPLTDTELRASSVAVTGPLTDAELRASAVPVSGPITDTELRATPVNVLGPLTDTELRATAVDVLGPLTDTELRAAPVEITNVPTAYNQDAWGRPKTVLDFSLFHGLWTYNVPNRIWEEYSIVGAVTTPLTSTGTNTNSTNHMLVVDSGTTANSGTALLSKRHPRYQPNRGHLFSTATILDNAVYDGIRRFGLIKQDNGVYFELEGDGAAWAMYAVRKSQGVVKTRQDITSSMPAGFDPEKGNVYDIQYQWRGLGDYKWFVNLELVYTDSILGTLTELSLAMPALPVCYESIAHSTDNLAIRAGCVDVTSEGGKEEGSQFSSISTGATLLKSTNTGTAMLGLRHPRMTTYNTVSTDNTRDMIASKIASWCRDEASIQVYVARDTVATNLDAATWTAHSDGTDEFLVGGTGSALDTAFQLDKASMELVLVEWNDLEQKNSVINPSNGTAPFYITPGDIMVIVVEPLGVNKDASVTLYYSEEI